MQDYYVIQNAVLYASKKFDGIYTSKPTLLHSIRCGLQLMNDGFSTEIVVAGILHDTVEDTSATYEEISGLFGAFTADVVRNNTKNPMITDKNKRRQELIIRCCGSNYESIVVKLADMTDNFIYYNSINDDKLIEYCRELKSYMLIHLPKKFHTVYVSSQLDRIE